MEDFSDRFGMKIFMCANYDLIHPQVQLRRPPGRRYVVIEFCLGIFAGIYFCGLMLLFVL